MRNTTEFVLGWHAAAVQLAKTLGLTTKVLHMPGGYADRLYVSGPLPQVRIFRTFPQVTRNPCGHVFSPGVGMPKWTEGA